MTTDRETTPPAVGSLIDLGVRRLPPDRAEVTDAEIFEAFLGANFGNAVPRDVLALSVLKKALRYHCGHTITEIMVGMGLTTPNGRVTERGRQFCYRELKLGRSG